ncbi:MAG: site-2 protease family protein [Planctomycetota bacterium]|jgi:regulator of sigma E protease
MPKAKSLLSKYFNALLWIAVFAAVISLIIRNIAVFGNLLLVAIGFGAVVLVHEFGHFILAKLSGIKVEAFSIGFPPTFAGILRTEQGWQIRILPKFFPKEKENEKDESDEGRLSFTLGKKAKPGETEYRIGLIPIGGFVKMLGQEDIGQVKSSDDPRSYANKPALTRMAVIAAGVTFNAISAGLILMIVFLIGINRVPAVVGGVVPNSPAAHAGLRAGDEIIEIAGKSEILDYYDIAVASALSGKNEKVVVKVRHEDETIEEFELVAEPVQGMQMKRFGIDTPMSLTIAEVSDTNELPTTLKL